MDEMYHAPILGASQIKSEIRRQLSPKCYHFRTRRPPALIVRPVLHHAPPLRSIFRRVVDGARPAGLVRQLPLYCIRIKALLVYNVQAMCRKPCAVIWAEVYPMFRSAANIVFFSTLILCWS
ncbi:MAG: hypothetical protein Q7S94_03840 [Gallionella sp.]|nr:hypothetical protein [Gallionella sp.]